MLTITSNADEVITEMRRLGPNLAFTAARRALNATLRNVSTELTQRLGKRLSLKAADIKAALTQRKASGEVLEAVLSVAFKPVELKRFPHRQTRKGVSVSVLRGNGRKTIAHAFEQEALGGHVFLRVGEKRVMTKGRYAGKVRQPIRKLFGPSVRQQAEPVLQQLRDSGWVTERLLANVRQETAGIVARENRKATARSGP